MICLSLQNKNLEQLRAIVGGNDVEMAEIRLDKCPSLSIPETEELFRISRIPLLATCRIGGGIQTKEAELRLSAAIKSGASFADLEIEAEDSLWHTLATLREHTNVKLIRSVHFYENTPSSAVLDEYVRKCRDCGADIVKLVTYAHDKDDVERVMSLYDRYKGVPLVAFCMGEAGKESRMECLRRGSLYTYVCLDGEATADGQWRLSEMNKALYGSVRPMRLDSVKVPASKSMAQRAIIAASLADGVSHLKGYSSCSDTESAIRVARTLGAEIEVSDTLTIKGIGANAAIPDEIFVGESGFLTRLMIPLISVLHNGHSSVKGEKTLIGRPLLYAEETMAEFGVTLQSVSGDKNGAVSVPLSINGRLSNSDATVTGKGGSQLISGLLAALPMAKGTSSVVVENPQSVPYLRMTLDVLAKFGIEIESDIREENIRFNIRGGQRYKSADVVLEGDWSGAAPFLIAGAIFGSADVPSLSMDSAQADKLVIGILRKAGATILSHGTSVEAVKSPLYAFDADLNQAPDLFPVVAVLAAYCEGQSHIKGVGRLASKESDRSASIIEMLTAMGVPCMVDGDTMTIDGMSYSRRLAGGNLLNGGKFSSHHDHRMVMAIKISSIGGSGEFAIDDTDCVAKSFPDFLEQFS